MRRLKIFHETIYDFPVEVALGPHKLLLRPREDHDVRIESSSLDISPTAVVKWHRDALDNSVAVASFDQNANQLKIISEVIIQHYDEWPLDFVVDDYAVQYPFAYENEEHKALFPFLQVDAQESEQFSAWMTQFSHLKGVETYTLLSQISQAITNQHQYNVREEPGVQSVNQTLENGSGSCRDYAWLFMYTARKLGLATRFVSGYLHAPGTELQYGSTHAWAEAYLPGAGWKGFDATSSLVTSCYHIPTGVATMPELIPPISGHYMSVGNALPNMNVRVQVRAI